MQVARAARDRAEQDRARTAAFAAVLQSSLLPPALPHVPGLQAACHYTTASVHDIGGDFYDIFPLGAGRWAFCLGDVSGRGATAAALTSMIRHTLRSTALLESDPRTVLEILNKALLADPTAGVRLCTLVFGTLVPDPAGGFTITLTGGGHPPAYHLRPRPAGDCAPVPNRCSCPAACFSVYSTAPRSSPGRCAWHRAKLSCSAATA
ncbi:hypothetical protein SRIMM317S_02140 [Streptomyces rimosus subsp. rimosus]